MIYINVKLNINKNYRLMKIKQNLKLNLVYQFIYDFFDNEINKYKNKEYFFYRYKDKYNYFCNMKF